MKNRCSPTEQALPKGTALEEFVVERVLGGGGFGLTYVAWDTRLDRWVVIKENLPAFYAVREPDTLTVKPRDGDAKNAEYFEESLEFFSREAKILASLNHPGIVPVLRSFEAFGTAFFVMPYVEGVSFADLIEERRHTGEPFSEAEAAGFLENVLDALGYLHRNEIFHRDIKPPNILVTREGKPVLIDFGAAWHNRSAETVSLIESSGYTAYEQIADNGRVGAWTDLYGLGATIYRAITFERPVSARDRQGQDAQVPLVRRTDLPMPCSAAFLRTVDRAVAVEIKNRWRTAGDWNTALSVIVRTGLVAPVGLVDERIQSQVGGSEAAAAPAEQATTPTTVPMAPATAGFPAGSVAAQTPTTPMATGAISPGKKKFPPMAAIVAGIAAAVVLLLGLVVWAVSGGDDASVAQADASARQSKRKTEAQLASERAAAIAKELEHQAKAESVEAKHSSTARKLVEKFDKFEKKKRDKKERRTEAKKSPAKKSVAAAAKGFSGAGVGPVHAEPDPRPGEVREFEIAPGVKVPFCWIPAGSFRMGAQAGESGRDADESPAREVKISRGFWMAKHETTQAEWRAVTGANRSRFKGESRPVEQVSWLEICGDGQRTGGFLGKIRKHAPAGWRFDLPSEAEWEYACRAGTRGPCPGDLDSLAWHKANSGRKTSEVGKKSPNSWGLLDICGNVAEWCRDWYQPSYGGLPGTDPEGLVPGAQRVLRGGCWASAPAACRPASRGKLAPDKGSAYVGFRLCLVPKEKRDLLLSEVDFKGVKIGWGEIGINVSVGKRRPLSIAGRKFSKGLGLHARSVLSFELDGKAKVFRAWIGVDDDAQSSGSVEFQVWADGRLAWSSGVLRRGGKAGHVEVALNGVRKLAIVCNNGGDGILGDHADWAEAAVEYFGKPPRLVVSESQPDFDPVEHSNQPAAGSSPASGSEGARGCRGARPGEEREFEIAPGVKMTFCWVPPGEFRMGSPESETIRRPDEGPVREVAIARGFWMGKFEVTRNEWRAVSGKTPSQLKTPGDDLLPVEKVSWMDICGNEERTGGFLGKTQPSAPAGWRFDLPTEAQWEYACRGGPGARTTRFVWGDSANGRKLNCNGSVPCGMKTKGPDLEKTVKVGSYEEQANHPLGLCDMHGNVKEWCRDWYRESYDGLSSTDPEGPGSGKKKVVRGGGWSNWAPGCRSARRHWAPTDNRAGNCGFRLCLVPLDPLRTAAQ